MQNISGQKELQILYTFRRCKSIIATILMAAILNLSSCYYYKVVPVKNNADEIINKTAHKYVILHLGEEVWHLRNIRINTEEQTLIAYREPVSPNHLQYKRTNPNTVNRYKNNERSTIYQVHIYVSEYSEGEGILTFVSLKNIQKIELYDEAQGATTASWFFGTIGVIAGAMVILLVIIILTKSSCPLIYLSDGHTFSFAGELYGGAISKPLERDDYLCLPKFVAFNDTFSLKISNELLERQYTNLAELIVVTHPHGTRAAIDATGRAHLIQNPVSPTSAVSQDKINQLEPIINEDSHCYSFTDANSDNPAVSSLFLSFQKPEHCDSGKLFINAKNSYWLDYVYGEFTKLFGTKYPQFAEKQKKESPAKGRQWSLDQHIPLSVYIQTKSGWEFVDYFNVTGPLAARDFVLSMDLSKVEGQKVNLKLETGLMFWDLNYAVMDFTDNSQITLNYISPASALDENGKDVSPALKRADDQYLFQPEVGNEAILKFKAPKPTINMEQTCFFHSRGYYEYIRDFKNKPDLAYLRTFQNKERFTTFALERYRTIMDDRNLVLKAFQADIEIHNK